VLRFVRNVFCEFQESTIGAAYLTKTINLPDAVVKLEICLSDILVYYFITSL